MKQGEKIDYPVDPAKSVVRRLPVEPGELPGLLSFLPFLKMEQYQKKAAQSREENLKAENCPYDKPANQLSPAKRKTKKVTHKYCPSCLLFNHHHLTSQSAKILLNCKKLKNYQ